MISNSEGTTRAGACRRAPAGEAARPAFPEPRHVLVPFGAGNTVRARSFVITLERRRSARRVLVAMQRIARSTDVSAVKHGRRRRDALLSSSARWDAANMSRDRLVAALRFLVRARERVRSRDCHAYSAAERSRARDGAPPSAPSFRQLALHCAISCATRTALPLVLRALLARRVVSAVGDGIPFRAPRPLRRAPIIRDTSKCGYAAITAPTRRASNRPHCASHAAR